MVSVMGLVCSSAQRIRFTKEIGKTVTDMVTEHYRTMKECRRHYILEHGIMGYAMDMGR